MTARRPPRISNYDTEITNQPVFDDDTSESDQDLEDPTTLVKQLSPQSTTTILHPSLTDYGPGSATCYFREALQELTANSLNKGNQKEQPTSLRRNQPRQGYQRSTRKGRKTVFDDSSDDDFIEDDYSTHEEKLSSSDGEGLAEGDDSQVPMVQRWTRPRAYESGVKRSFRKRAPPQPLFGSESHHPNLVLGAPETSPLDHAPAPPSESSRALRKPRRPETKEVIQPIEDPNLKHALGFDRKICACRLICFCEPEITAERDNSTSQSPLPLPKSMKRNNITSMPAKQATARPRGGPSKSTMTTSAIGRSFNAMNPSTRISALLSSRRRTQDFEEHASEKRRSARLGGDNDFHEGPPDLSEPDSISTQSPQRSSPAGTGLSRRLGLDQFRGSVPDAVIGGNSSAAVVGQNTEATRSGIGQLLDGLHEDMSTGLLKNRTTRLQAKTAAHTSSLDQVTGPVMPTFSTDNSALEPQHLRGLFDSQQAEAYSPMRLSRRGQNRNIPNQWDLDDFDGIGVVADDRMMQADRFASLLPNLAKTSQTHAFKATSGFDYRTIIPKEYPKELFKGHRGLRDNAHHRPYKMDGISESPRRDFPKRLTSCNITRPDTGVELSKSILLERLQHCTKTWEPSPFQVFPNAPPDCTLGQDGQGWPETLPVDIFMLITRYLSVQDVHNLRCVNSYFESVLAPVVFRNVVIRFGKSMFDIGQGKWERKAPEGSMFEKYGMEISKFGIAFEVDVEGLQSASPKVIQNTQHSWWGKYTWPVPVYPRFSSLEQLENLADHLPLLRGAFKDLTNVSELALCIDSGHGWLNGPDLSDMAVWNAKSSKGSEVFGRTFRAVDKWHQHGREELFRWAQANSINEAIKSLTVGANAGQSLSECQFLKAVAIRDINSYAVQFAQPDLDTEAHTGGIVPAAQAATFNAQHPQNYPQPMLANWGWQPPAIGQNNFGPPVGNQYNYLLPPPHFNPAAGTTRRIIHDPHGRLRARPRITKGEVIHPQWPIIYNGHNLAAEVGGHCGFIQNKLADPKAYPIQPGKLSEAQAQWLMETVWAQRAFLSAYITAVLTHKANFKHIHSLHIAKISSGLLPSLEQRDFWQSLPSLRTLKLLVSPDWRTEYTPGDQSYQSNMLIPPVHASTKFAEFLQRYVARIEHLCTLTIGFVGGGEHATGLLARNQHVLPAPITFDPRSWLTDHITKPNPNTMIAFNHIKDLTIENAWLSPIMLETFMSKSRDTSLRHLTLNSVSLTGVHSQRTSSMTTLEDGMKPNYSPGAWLQERLPAHCWPAVIDRLTPGTTFCQMKYATGLIDADAVEQPERDFRGNVEKVTFISCGYVRVSGIPQTEFNQNGLVVPHTDPRDHGLVRRENMLRSTTTLGEAYGNVTESVMLRDKDPQGHEWFGLGKLTQCVHPIEKIVLEQAWGMGFGWGDDLERFSAVEDGCFEGGTGRFSGEVMKA